MGRACTDELLPDGAVLMIMQGFAAAGADPEIRAHVRQKFGDMVMEFAELGGVAPGDVWAFFATGMQLNIVAALELQQMVSSLTPVPSFHARANSSTPPPSRGVEVAWRAGLDLEPIDVLDHCHCGSRPTPNSA
jgi:hypothetical protein